MAGITGIICGDVESRAPPGADRAESFAVELLDFAELPALRAAWEDLAARALEPNIFLEPDFALPALAYLRPAGLKILALFGTCAAPQRRLLALMPIVLPPSFPGLARVPMHKQAALGLPLIDRAAGADALTALIGGLKRLYPALSVLLFSHIPQEGPTCRLLAKHFSGTGAFRIFDSHLRAALFPEMAAEDKDREDRSRKTKAQKNALRQLRRLGEQGALAYRVRSGAAAEAAMEDFLALEARGWKGASRTALASAPDRATFARRMVEGFARQGRLSIESLDLDGRPVAMGIVIAAGDKAYFWKTTYDEAYAAFSPGVLFVRQMTGRIAAQATYSQVDSCAAPDHSLIDRLWSGRIAMADVAVVLRPGARADAALMLESLRRRLRGAAKRLLARHASRGRAPIAAVLRARS